MHGRRRNRLGNEAGGAARSVSQCTPASSRTACGCASCSGRRTSATASPSASTRASRCADSAGARGAALRRDAAGSTERRQSVVDTMVARLGKRRAMPAFAINDADWSLKLQAKKYRKWLVGKMRDTAFDALSPLALRAGVSARRHHGDPGGEDIVAEEAYRRAADRPARGAVRPAVAGDPPAAHRARLAARPVRRRQGAAVRDRRTRRWRSGNEWDRSTTTTCNGPWGPVGLRRRVRGVAAAVV